MATVCTLNLKPHDPRDKVSLLAGGWYVLLQASPLLTVEVQSCVFESEVNVNVADEHHNHYPLFCLPVVPLTVKRLHQSIH